MQNALNTPTRPSRLHSLFSLSSLCSLFLASAAHAQDLTHKAPPQSEIIVIVGATVHPVASEPIADAAIRMEDGAIASITSAAEWADLKTKAKFGKPVREIDGRGKHVYPGLITPFTALGLTEIQAVAATIDTSETGNVTPEVKAITAVNPDSTLIPVTRSNGILIAGVFPGGGTIPGRPSAVRLDGWTNEEMAVDDAVGVFLRWPNVRPITAWWLDRSEEDQMKEIRENLAAIERTFDAAKAYADAKAADASAPADLRWEAMRPLWDKQQYFPLYISAQDVEQITSAVTFATQRGMKPVLVGGRDAALCSDLLKKHQVAVIVQGTHVMPRRDDAPYDDGYSLPARLHAAGLTVAIANNDDTANERNLPYSAGKAAAFGLPREEALRAITINAAKILGIADRYGTLESGKSATLILTTGDPLEVTTQVVGAFIDGREVDLSNKQIKLTEKYLDRYRQSGQLPAK